MTPAEVWNVALAVIASLGGGALLVLALSNWLGKVWANRLLEKERAEHSRDLEKIRADLQKSGFEHQTRFSWYYHKKAQIIAELYSLLNDAIENVKQLVSPVQFGGDEYRKKRVSETITLYNQLAKHFYGQRIFLERDVCDQVESIIKTMRDALNDWELSQDPNFKGRDSLKLWNDAYKSMSEKVPPLLKELEERFRIMLSGVESPTNPSLQPTRSAPA